MSYFDDTFPGVRVMLEMLERDRAANARPHKPWCITGLNVGHRVVQESFDTEGEARARYAEILGGRPANHWTIADLSVEHRP